MPSKHTKPRTTSKSHNPKASRRSKAPKAVQKTRGVDRTYRAPQPSSTQAMVKKENSNTLLIKTGEASKTGRKLADERKYRKLYIQAATKNQVPIIEEEVEKYIFAQTSQQVSYKIEDADHEVIRHHVWDKGLQGASRRTQREKDKFDDALNDLFPNKDFSDIQFAGVRNAVRNSINNARGTQRAIWAMCDNDSREDVVSRIASLLFRLNARGRDLMEDEDAPSNEDLLERYGIRFNPPPTVSWDKDDGTITVRD